MNPISQKIELMKQLNKVALMIIYITLKIYTLMLLHMELNGILNITGNINMNTGMMHITEHINILGKNK